MRETKAVRPGEEIDTERLGPFMTSKMSPTGGEIIVEQFPAGSSNLTYLVRFGDAEYVLRRPPYGNTVKSAHDMRREFDVLSKLSVVYSPAPKPRLFCDDHTIIGSEFYLMERRKGVILRGRAPEELEKSPSSQRKLCESFVKNLAVLHSLDIRKAGLATLGKPENYCRRQVEGWSKRYFAAKTGDVRDLEKVIAWLNENIPGESGASIVHNDYKFDNVMLDPGDLTRITAVLDWEMVTVGDPLMDLGTTLGYWMSEDAGEELLSMPFNPRVLMENISRAELVEMYENSLGRAVRDMLFYYVFGTFKIAVIAQQIYARYVNGFTMDARFATFDKFVAALGRIASGAVQRQSI